MSTYVAPPALVEVRWVATTDRDSSFAFSLAPQSSEEFALRYAREHAGSFGARGTVMTVSRVRS